MGRAALRRASERQMRHDNADSQNVWQLIGNQAIWCKQFSFSELIEMHAGKKTNQQKCMVSAKVYGLEVSS